ncbi:MAG: adenosine kinase [Acidimicrobiales bacterium]
MLGSYVVASVDVCGIGSALVDILVETTPAQVDACGLVKGSMQLMDLDAAEKVHAAVPGGIERSGGSCANTIAGLAALGADAGFIGRVADDRFGQVFADGMADLGVRFGAGGRADPAQWATGRCLILVTPDADRTMCTTLGAASHLGPDQLDAELIQVAHVTYLEGYLWDEPVAIDALRAAIEIAHGAGRRVAMTLSDSFCVDRHRDAWRDLVASELDLLFGNEAELCSLAGSDAIEDACAWVRRSGLTVTVTLGADGALAFVDHEPAVRIPAVPVPAVVDTTGAGDLYAAGFLHAFVRGKDLETSARVGAIAAAEVIGHVGGRAEADIASMVAGLLG